MLDQRCGHQTLWETILIDLSDSRLDHDRAVVSRWARTMLCPGMACVLDTETTDFDGAIVEVAVIDASSGRTVYDSLVRPGLSIHPSAAAVHGIRDVDVAHAPGWPAVLAQLLEVTAGYRAVLAYNAPFDLGRVQSDSARWRLDPGPLGRPDRWSCLMERRMAFLGRDRPMRLNGGHRALGDTRAAREVLLDFAAHVRIAETVAA